MEEKKFLMIFPPQWTPVSPHYALPTLLGQLQDAGYYARGLDLNIDFFDKILTPERINNASDVAIAQFGELKQKIAKIYSPSKKENDYTLQEKIIFYKYNKLKKYFSNTQRNPYLFANFINSAKNVFKSEEFFEPEKLIKALNIIDNSLEIISLPFTPTKIEFDGVQNPFFKFNFESIKYFVFDKSSNIFIDYYKSIISSIKREKYDFIGISLNSSSQIVPGLTLANMLKKETNAHINIGGNFFGRIVDELCNHSDFFDLFAHSLSFEEGEGPITILAKYISGGIPIEEVPNLMYKKGDKVCINPKMKSLKLDDMANISLDGYDLSKYFAPKIVLPYQTSRGCYWGKCSFCDQAFGQNLNVKKIDKVIADFIELKRKYDIDNFEFIDESISPLYLKDFAQKLIDEKVDVRYFSDARLETAFNSEVFNVAYKSGLRMLLWGLESGSDSVMELINKGIDIGKRFDILQQSKDALLWNFAFIFFGFPTETMEDARKTINMLVEHKDIIHSYGRSVFTMGRHSKLAGDPEFYGITKIYPAEEEFSPNINFDSVGMNSQELNTILNECKTECAKAYQNPLWMYLRYREWLFLYVDKYGADWVSHYQIKL